MKAPIDLQTRPVQISIGVSVALHWKKLKNKDRYDLLDEFYTKGTY